MITQKWNTGGATLSRQAMDATHQRLFRDWIKIRLSLMASLEKAMKR